MVNGKRVRVKVAYGGAVPKPIVKPIVIVNKPIKLVLPARPVKLVRPTLKRASFCPSSHPFVYYNGDYCCSGNKEKVNAAQGSKCDGSAISRSSMCCNGGYKRCPGGKCVNNPKPYSMCFRMYKNVMLTF